MCGEGKNEGRGMKLRKADMWLEGSFDRVGRVVALNCSVCLFHLL